MKLNVTIEEDYDFYESRIIPLGKLVKIGEYRNALYAITMTEIKHCRRWKATKRYANSLYSLRTLNYGEKI